MRRPRKNRRGLLAANAERPTSKSDSAFEIGRSAFGVRRFLLKSTARDSSTSLGMTEQPKPVVAFYCATFLKAEMLHIYRQITQLERLEPFVIAQKREHAGTFPFDKIDIVRKPITH